MRKVWVISLLLLNFSAFAAVYQWVDSQGVVNYGSEPRPGAIKMDLDALPYSVVPVDSLQINHNAETLGVNNVSKPVGQGAAKADAIVILSPSDQETFQNQNTITVNFSMQSQMPSGGVISLYLDGKLFNSITEGNSFTLQNIERGSHSLQVRLLDANGNSLEESQVVTIYVHLPTVHLLR